MTVQLAAQTSACHVDSTHGANQPLYVWQLNPPRITMTQCAEPHNDCMLDDCIVRLSRQHNARSPLTTPHLAAQLSAYRA